MTPTVKIVTGIAGVGVVGSGVGYAISSQFATENISKKLTDEGYQILNENENTEWNSILTSYLATVSSKDNLKFKDFEIKTGDEAKLKQACQKALESPSTDNHNYEKAKHWCTVPRTVTNLLDKEGYRSLSTKTALESDDNIDKGEWDKKLDEHAKATGDAKTKQFTGDNKIAIEGQAKKDKQNRDAIKGKCKGLENKKHYEIDFDTNLAKSKLWCAIPKTAGS